MNSQFEYQESLNSLRFTDEQKEAIARRAAEAARQQTRQARPAHRRPVRRMALVAAAAVLVLAMGTAGATGILRSAVEVFSPLFGGAPAQTEIIDQIGYPVGASDTDNGVTVTADAVMGDAYNAVIVYTISRDDGTALLPEGTSGDMLLVRGNGFLKLQFKLGFKPHKETLLDLLNIGLPAMIEQLLMRAGMIIFSRTVAGLGTVPYATHQVCMNIQALSFMTGQAFAVSSTTLMGQSLGKRRPDMAQAYCSRTRRVGMGCAIVIALVFIFFGRYIVELYNSTPEIVETGARILLIVAVLQPLQTSQFIIAGGLRGAGDTRATAVITFITVLLVRPAVAIILINYTSLGLYGAWIAMACDQLLRSTLVLLRFQSGKWKTIRMYSETNSAADKAEELELEEELETE